MRMPAAAGVRILAAAALVAGSCSGSDVAVAESSSSTVDPVAPSTIAAAVPSSTAAPTATSTPTAAPTSTPDPFPPFPPQPEGLPWPTEEWPTGELPADADADAINDLLDSAFERAAFGEIHAVLLVLDGELVIERYGRGYTGQEPHASYSISKSVTHALLGRLVADGLIDMHAPAAIEEWADDERAAITPDMLLRMTTGLRWVENIDNRADAFGLTSGGAAGVLVERELTAEPGTVFEYNTGSTGLLGRIMTDLVGRGEDFDAWAHEQLFDRIGITSASLAYDTDGVWLAGSQANMNAQDFARFGYLYLRGGEWDGEQVLEEAWIDYGRTLSPPNDRYGAGWWVGDGVMLASGARGQNIVVLPAEGDLLVVLSNNAVDGDRTWQFVRRLAPLIPSDGDVPDD